MSDVPKEIHAARGYSDANEGVWNGIHSISGQTLEPNEEETSYLRSDHVDALLKQAREDALREGIAKINRRFAIYSDNGQSIKAMGFSEAAEELEALIKEDKTDG